MNHRRRFPWQDAGILAASAGLTLIEPRALKGWKKTAYWAAVSALAGASAVGGRQKESEFGWYAYAPLTGASMPGRLRGDVGVFTGVTGTVFALQEPLLKADAWMIDKLEAKGLKRPRVALAAFAALAGAVMLWSETRTSELEYGPQGGEPMPTIDVEPRVRQVVAEMLAKTDEWGAAELRAQFGEARQLGAMADGYVQFDVPHDVESLPVDSFVFPVHGRGTLDGVDVLVMLHVEDGRIEALSLDGAEGPVDRIPDDLTYELGPPRFDDHDDED